MTVAVRFHVPYTDHLVALVADAAAAAARIDAADRERVAALAASARRESARLSARLDASPLDDAVAEAVDAGVWRVPATPALSPAAVAPSAQPAGGWASALKLDRLPTEDLAALEYANLLACFDAEPGLAADLFERPLEALTALHAIICRGLVDRDVVGRPRRTVQAVHDGAQGKVIYNPPAPERLPALLAELDAWLTSDRRRRGGQPGSARLPAVVVAAVVHERLLEWQPFEAGNGRLARAAARLVLRARGLDSHGVGVTERLLAADPAGYYGEVAATIRRGGDLGLWVERHVEATVAGLEAAADALAPAGAPPPPARAAALLVEVAAGDTVTVTDYAARLGVSRATAAADLRALARRGLLQRAPGTSGLRYRRPAERPR